MQCTMHNGHDSLSLSLSLSLSPPPLAKTPIGEFLIADLHGVTEAVSRLTQNALVYMSFYPMIDSIVSK